MVNKDDMNELPDDVKRLIEFAQKDGADVSVIRINKNKDKDKKINNILSKLNNKDKSNSSKLLDELDDLQDKVSDNVSHKDIKDYMKKRLAKLNLDDLSDADIFTLINNSYMDLLKACGRKPALHILLTVADDGKADLRTVGIDGQDELGAIFSNIGDMISNGDVPIDSKNMGEL